MNAEFHAWLVANGKAENTAFIYRTTVARCLRTPTRPVKRGDLPALKQWFRFREDPAGLAALEHGRLPAPPSAPLNLPTGLEALPWAYRRIVRAELRRQYARRNQMNVDPLAKREAMAAAATYLALGSQFVQWCRARNIRRDAAGNMLATLRDRHGAEKAIIRRAEATWRAFMRQPEWHRALKRDPLCRRCKGSGMIKVCANCSGTGRHMHYGRDSECGHCHGYGVNEDPDQCVRQACPSCAMVGGLD